MTQPARLFHMEICCSRAISDTSRVPVNSAATMPCRSAFSARLRRGHSSMPRLKSIMPNMRVNDAHIQTR
jgi:hypothetical protein